jgi:CBS domain-containing protein
MKATRDSETPGEEFRVAAAGPAVSLLLALIAAVASIALEGAGSLWDVATLNNVSTGMLEVLVSFTASINAALLVFNLIPAFPLDGGRIARAAVWRVTGDRQRATRFSAYLGQAFAVLLIGYGAYLGFAHGRWGSALWYMVLGWILGSAARGAVLQSTVLTRLEGVTAGDIMDAEPVTIPAALPVERAYEDFFLRYQGWPWFAVVEDDGRFTGLAHRAAVEHAAHSGTSSLPVRSVTADAEQVRVDTSLEALWGSEPLRRLGALMAVDADGRLRGVVTIEQVTRALQARLAPS